MRTLELADLVLGISGKREETPGQRQDLVDLLLRDAVSDEVEEADSVRRVEERGFEPRGIGGGRREVDDR